MPSTPTLTADELLRLNLPDKRTELLSGHLVVREPPGYVHGYVALKIARVIANYVEPRNLGHVLAAETGFKLRSNPDTVRASDVAFVRRERIPNPPPRGYPEMAPDLAVEVLSPDDRHKEVVAKVADWLEAGASLVWVVDPIVRTARVYRANGSATAVPADGTLEGEDVLPGFACKLTDVFG